MLSLTTRLTTQRVVTALLLVFASQTAFAQTARDDYVNARGLYKSRRYEQAAEAFEKFFNTYPEDPLAKSFARLYYGVTLGELKRYEPARKQLDIFIENNPNDVNLPDMMYRRGEYSYYLRDYETAEKQLGEFRTKYPEHKLVNWAYLFEAESQLALGKWKPARSALTALSNRKPDRKLQLEANYGLARTYEGEKDLAQAFNFYRKLVKAKDPAMSPRALSRMGTHYLNANDLDDAIKVYSLIIDNYPDNTLVPWAKFNAGLAYFRKKDFAKASDWFNQASGYRTNQPRASMMHAVSLQNERKVDQSNAKLKQLITDYPKNTLVPEMKYHLGFGLRAADRDKEALAAFEDVFTKTPTSQFADDAMYYAADVAVQLKRTDKAETLLSRLDKDYPQHPYKDRARVLAGRIRASGSGNADLMEAVAEFQKALEDAKTPDDQAKSRYYLTQTYRKLGQHEKAVEAAKPLVAEVNNGKLNRFNGILIMAASSYYNLEQFAETTKLSTKYIDAFANGEYRRQALRLRARSAARERKREVADADIATLNEIQSEDQHEPFVYELAEIAYGSGDYAWAADLYESLTARATSGYHARGLSGLGWANFKQKKYANARKHFQQLITDHATDTSAVESGFMIGKSLELEERFNDAAKAYEDTFRNNLPREPQPAGAEFKSPLQRVFASGRQAARIYNIRLEKFEDADRVFTQLTTAFPEAERLDEILESWAFMLYDSGKGEQGDKLLKRLLTERPTSPRVHTAKLHLAESDMLANRDKAAAEAFGALAANVDAPADVRESASYFQIKVADKTNQKDKLLLQLTQAHLDQYDAGEFSPHVRLYRAQALHGDGRKAEAETLLGELREEILSGRVPQRAWFGRVWVLLGQIQVNRKQYEDARKLGAEMLARQDCREYANQMHHVIGQTHMLQAPPDFNKARTELNRAISLRNTGIIAAKCQLLVADTYVSQRNYERAASAYLRVFTNHRAAGEIAAQALLQAGRCEEELNKPEDAARSYGDLIKEFPQSRYTAEAKLRLEKLKPASSSEQSGQ